MRIGIFGRRRALTGLLLVVLAPAALGAQERSSAGTARISDRSARKAPSGIQRAGLIQAAGQVPADGNGPPPVPPATDSASSAPAAPTAANGAVLASDPDCALGGWWGGWAQNRWACHCARKQACLMGYTGRPFAYPPGVPVQRVTNIYQQYWPAAWTGQAVGGPAPQFPMVYQPTDTTQLGFYYKQVPYWYPQPQMLPPPPVPYWPVGMGPRRGACLPGYGVPLAGGAPVVEGGVVTDGTVTDGTAPAPATTAPEPAPAAGDPPAAAPATPPVIVPEPEANLNPRQVN